MADLREHWILSVIVIVSEHLVGLQVLFHVANVLIIPPSLPEVGQGHLVHWEKPYGSPIFRAHV